MTSMIIFLKRALTYKEKAPFRGLNFVSVTSSDRIIIHDAESGVKLVTKKVAALDVEISVVKCFNDIERVTHPLAE